MQHKLYKVSVEQIHQRLRQEAAPDSEWVFDCDGTLINGDVASMTAWALIRFGFAHPDMLPPEYDDFKNLPFDYSEFRKLRKLIIAKKGINSIYEWETFLHAGLPVATSYDTAKLAIEEGLKNGSLKLTGALSTLAYEHRLQAWIVSGSPEFCVWSVADKVGIKPERVIGTRLESVDGISAPRIVPPGVIWEELKRTALKTHKVHHPYFVAGDSIGDWQMMEMSTRWCWAVIWDEHRHRGEEMRQIMQARVLDQAEVKMPTEPGLYVLEGPTKNWVLEIRDGE